MMRLHPSLLRTPIEIQLITQNWSNPAKVTNIIPSVGGLNCDPPAGCSIEPGPPGVSHTSDCADERSIDNSLDQRSGSTAWVTGGVFCMLEAHLLLARACVFHNTAYANAAPWSPS